MKEGSEKPELWQSPVTLNQHVMSIYTHTYTHIHINTPRTHTHIYGYAVVMSPDSEQLDAAVVAGVGSKLSPVVFHISTLYTFF